MKDIDAIDRSFRVGYEQGAKDYKEQRDLLLQEIAELSGKIEQLTKERDAAVERMRSNCKYCKNNFESAWEWRGIDE